jgi:hypothetical protein
MPVIDWIVLTPAEAETAEALSDANVALGARLIDNPASGMLHLQYSVPLRVLHDTDYLRWHPLLEALPTARLASESLFLPAED